MVKNNITPKSHHEAPNATDIMSTLDPALWPTITSYLPSIIIDTLHQCSDPGSPWIHSVEGSLLLADITGFTPMTEKLSEVGKEGAEWLTDIINKYFHSMLDIAVNYGGDNLKFGGDALLVLFQGENHALRAVATALAMQKATRKFTTFQVGGHSIRLRMTVGVHSGSFFLLTAGLPGYSMQHFILGPDTNLIGEIQALATAGEFVISEQTMNLIGNQCVADHRDGHYLVRRLRTNPDPPQIIERGIERNPDIVREIIAHLPAQIAQGLRSNGQIRKIEGEHRKVVIAFINLLGINELLEEQGPESLLGELQKYLSVLLQLCKEYNGFISGNDVYTNGLKIILVFGAPVAHEYDASNALHLALELESELQKLNLHLSHKVGINSGYVFAGDVGPPYRRQYTVMGDAVNLAARLMSSCTPNQTRVSSQTITEAGPNFLSRELPPIRVKGKNEPVTLYSLEGEQSVASAHASESRVTLFGRENEIALFNETCIEVSGGKGRTIVVSGEAGIGKSHLIRKYREHIDSLDWTTHSGRCQSHTTSKPFTPWIEILNSFFSLTPEDNIESRNHKVQDTVGKIEPEFVEWASLLNSLLNLSIPQTDVVRSLDDESRRRRLFEIISRLFYSSARKSPIIILIEDLHWADHSSIELINWVGNGIGSSHLLMCLNHRPKKGFRLNLPAVATLAIDLRELPKEDAILFVQSVLGQTQLPDHIAVTILSKARGNPLFLEEIAISINESGNLEKVLGASAFESSKTVSSLDVPDRIQTLLMSRIDTLNDVTKEILRTASVVGFTFDIPTLQPLLSFGSKGVDLPQYLQELVQLDFITPELDSQEPLYRFKHALIQDVSYDSLLFARRRELHLSLANYLEETNVRQLEPMYDILVHHYSYGQDNPKTQYYAEKAANKARQVFAHEEAIDYYRRGLNSVEGDDSYGLSLRSYFLELIADCFELSGNHVEAVRNFLSALNQWRKASGRFTLPSTLVINTDTRLPTRVREALLLHKISVSHERNSNYDLSLKWLQNALDTLPERHPLQEAKICMTKSVALFRKGQYDGAIHWGKIGLASSRRSRDLGQLAYAHTMLASSYVVTGNLKKALRHRLAAVHLYEEVGDIAGQAVAYNNLAGCYQNMGDIDNAMKYYPISLNACERMGNHVRIAIASNNIGEVLLIKGRTEEAVEYFQRVVETYEKRGDPLAVTGLSLINLSRASLSLEQRQEALEYLKRGKKLLKKAGTRGLMTEASIQEAELYLAMGKTETALRVCQSALKDTREMGLKILEVRALRNLGRINTVRDGGYAHAESYLKESLLTAEQNTGDYEKALSLMYLAELWAEHATGQPRHHRFKRTIDQAVRILQRIGAKRDLARALKIQSYLTTST